MDEERCNRCDDMLEEDGSRSEWEEKAAAVGLCLRCWEEDRPVEKES